MVNRLNYIGGSLQAVYSETCQSNKGKGSGCRLEYVRIISVDTVFKLMAGDRCQLIDSRLGKAELVGALRQVE